MYSLHVMKKIMVSRKIPCCGSAFIIYFYFDDKQINHWAILYSNKQATNPLDIEEANKPLL